MNVLWTGTYAQRLRLLSGLVLFTFALTHFLNHAVGLFGVDAMLAVQGWRLEITRSLPVSLILGLALLTHMGLALMRLIRCRTTKMPLWEAGQMMLGFSIPFLLFPHILNTRFANLLFGVNDTYVYELLQLWPRLWLGQSTLLLIVWVHGCMGLHYWLRLSAWYRRVLPFAFGLAVLIPFAALAGFLVAGQAIQAAAGDPQTLSIMRDQANWPEGDALDWLIAWTALSYYAFYPFLLIALLYMALRWALSAMGSKLTIAYVPKPTVRTLPGPTLLEISRANGVPHMSVCGGRARCSTCRVEVIEGLGSLPPPGPAERDTLQRIAAGPLVRLACQISPSGPVTVRTMVHSGSAATALGNAAQGVERTLAVLFLDIRGFTNWSQDKLPYDVVFILNRTFGAAGSAIEDHGGWIDKYMGDGLMAVFGRESGPERGCAEALEATRAIDLAIDGLNRDLGDELGAELKIGMGLHVGPLVMGEIGHDESAAMTVIGASVNTASRLEAMTKELNCQLIVSAEAMRQAGIETAPLKPKSVKVRGLDKPLDVIAFQRARDLPAT